MARQLRQVSLQEILTARGSPLDDKALWALLQQASTVLQKTFQVNGSEDPNLLITPESMLLNYGSTLQFLAGIPLSTSNFTAPEFGSDLESERELDPEKLYVHSLGMTLLAAMRNGLDDLMSSQVNNDLYDLFVCMTDDNFKERPSLEEICRKCVHFQSETDSTDEINKLVDYYFGTNLENASDFGDDEIDKANLKTELQQVIDMKVASSVENLCPSSCDGRAARSLSIRSDSGYPQFATVKNQKSSCEDGMYSSLPMVSSHDFSDTSIKPSQIFSPSPSGDTDNHYRTGERQLVVEPKNSNVSHSQLKEPFQREEPVTEDVDDKITAFRRSSFDKDDQSEVETVKAHDVSINDVPLLPSASTENISFEGEVSILLPGSGPSELTPSTQNVSAFDYSEPSITGNCDPSHRSDVTNIEDFNFPSPPGVPSPPIERQSSIESSMHSGETKCSSTIHSEDYNESMDGEHTDATEGSNTNINAELSGGMQFPESHESDSELLSTFKSRADDYKSYLINERLHDVTPTNQTMIRGNMTSLKKLGKMFGPEFKTMSGIQIEKKNTEKMTMRIPSTRRLVEVIMLSGQSVEFIVERSSTCRELFNQVVAHQCLEETHIFGLTIINVDQDHDEVFLEFDRKLRKYAPKGWASNSPPYRGALHSSKFTVLFQVQYYVENVNQLRLSQTRHLYFLQLRKDILEGKTHCHEQSALKLAAYALQAEKGNEEPTCREYYHTEDYLPSKAISKLGQTVIKRILPGMHSELRGQSRERAELNFLREAQTLPEYGMVFYKVAEEKHGKIGSIRLGLSVRGIVTYNVYKDIKTPISHWSWKSIKNLSFGNKIFFVEVVDRKKPFRFYTESYKKARYLLHLSIYYHRFQLLTMNPPENSDTNVEPFYPAITPASLGSDVVPSENEDTLDREGKGGCKDLIELDRDLNSNEEGLPEGITFSLELVQDKGVLGLRLAGGRNKRSGRGYIYIKSLTEDSVAARSGEIKERDILLEVNQTKLKGMTHHEAASLIRVTTSVSLCIHRPHNFQWIDSAGYPNS